MKHTTTIGMKKILTVVFLFTAILCRAQTHTYYFDAINGDDNRTAAQAQVSTTAWKTLPKLNSFMSSLVPGDKVLFRRGQTFYGFITASKSGTSTQNIKFGAWDTGNRPIITGFKNLTTWTNIGGNIWERTTVDTVSTVVTNIVTVNGVNVGMGSTAITINSHTSNTQAVVNSLTGTPSYVGAELIARSSNASWIVTRNLITSQDTTKLNTSPNYPNPCGFSVNAFADGAATIQNSPFTLDTQNEWYYTKVSSTTGKLRMYSTVSPAGLNVKMATIDSLVRVTGAFLTFDSLDFQGANTDCFQLVGNTCQNLTISNCNIAYVGNMGIKINNSTFNGAANMSVLNCTFQDCQNSCMNESCSGNSGNSGRQIIGNTFRRTNIIFGTGGSLDGQNMVIAFTNNSSADSIRYNVIDSSSYIGIFDVGSSFTIRNNFITNTCLTKTDGGAIYTARATGAANFGRRIIGNICLRSPSSNGQGIYMDDNATQVQVEGNTTYGFSLGIYIHNGHEINVRNNVSYANRSASLSMSQDAGQGPIRNVSIRRNTFVMASSGSSLGNMSYGTNESPLAGFGTSDSNAIATPTNDINAVFTSTSGPTFNHFTLAGWQAATSQDLHSVKSPKIVSDTTSANVRFLYNPSQSPTSFTIPGTWEDMRGNIYPSTITLQPFTSTVLLFVSNTGSNLTATSSAALNPVSCFGNTTTITVTATGGTTPYTYNINGGSFGSSNVFTGRGAGTYTLQVKDNIGTIATTQITITQPTQITISQTSGTISVNGGTTTTTVTASGGTGTLQYSRDGGTFQSSNVFTGVPAGTHTITVRDANNCTNTLTYTLTQPSALVVSAAATTNALTCFGNTTTITVTASGATPPYQYQLNSGSFQTSNLFTSQPAGSYTITVRDASGATKTTSITITQPTQIIITESHTAINVNGGTSTVTVTASGGTGTLNYSLDGSAYQVSNLFGAVLAGNHVVTVRDASLCTNNLTFTITQPTALVVSAAATTNPLTCFGNTTTITVTASGGTSPYTYSINGGSSQTSNLFTGRGAGTYTLTVTDAANIVKTTTLTITQPTQMTISESHTTISVNGGTSTITVTASGGTGTLNYSLDGGAFQASNSFSGVLAGSHAITVRDGNSCTNTLNFNITQPTSLSVTAAVTTSISCNGGSGVITVTATGGTPPYQYRRGNGALQSSNLFTVTAGTYTFTVVDNLGSTVSSSATTITQPNIITYSVGIAGAAPATVTISTPAGGVAPYQFRLDAGIFQTSNVFTGVSAGNHTATVRDANLCTITKSFNVGTPLKFSMVVGTILCNGGSTTVAVNATGGTPPYAGTGTFTRSAGTWSFTVTDVLGARADTTIVITQPSPINISSISFSAISVNGGTTTVTVTSSGGVGTLNYKLDAGTFQVSNSFTLVSAGNHTMTVRDGNGCLQTSSFSIPQPGTLGISISLGTAISCNGGTTTVTVTGSGGTAPYTYGKNGTFQSGTLFSNLASGTYTFSVKDAFSNQKDTIITISQPTALSLSVTTGTILVNGGTTSVTASGSGGTGSLQYSLDGGAYQGSGSFASVSAGTHIVTLKDANNCTTSNTFTITQPGALVVGISGSVSLSCYGGTTTITVSGIGGTAPYTYGKNGVFQSSATFSSITAGTYTFSVKDALGARADTIITISTPSAIIVSVTTGTISANGGTTTVTATASGGTGSLQYKLDGGSYQGSGSFSGVSAGIHTVTVKDANNCTQINTFSISQPGILYISVTVTTNPLACYGDQTNVTVGASGGTTPYSGTGSANYSAGTYSFTVTDAFGETADTIITIEQPPLITLIQVSQTKILVRGGTADTVTIQNAGGTPINDSVYEYNVDGAGYVQSDSAFKYEIYNVSGGNHTVSIRDDNGCVVTYSFTIIQPKKGKPSTGHVYAQLQMILPSMYRLWYDRLRNTRK